MAFKDQIIFQDEYLAILYKNKGQDSQIFYRDFFSKFKYAEVVNRLDQPVSGLLILAFSKKVHTKFNEAFTNSKIKKEYWAICKKTEKFTLGTKEYCEDFLRFNKEKKKAFILENPTDLKDTKKAQLVFSVMGQGKNFSFVKVFPLTGRTHQIRVQLAHRNMPIKGDIKYGSKRTEKMGGIRLHSYSLEFEHPITKNNLQFKQEPLEKDALWNACCEACYKNP